MNFQEKVLKKICEIPKGKVASYSEIARVLNSHANRAVGSVCKSNYDLKIPCWRVVKKSGEIGEFNRGQKEKIRLLKKEGLYLIGKKIPKKYFFFFKKPA